MKSGLLALWLCCSAWLALRCPAETLPATGKGAVPLPGVLPAGCVLAGHLSDARINESSGLAAGRRNPHVLWTLNDSGGGPFVFAVDTSGKALARFEIAGAFNLDWEDIASGPDAGGTPSLFLADIGDNLSCRPLVEIYQFKEPEIQESSAETLEARVEETTVFRGQYPDGCHDAEALLAHPVTGALFIITKQLDGHSGVYAFPMPLRSDAAMKLERVAELQFKPENKPGKRPVDNCLVTAASFSPDGSRVIIGTYSNLYEWEITSGKTLAEALAAAPSQIETPLTRQCEAVCYSADGDCVWITSEKIPAPLYRIRTK